MVGRRGAAASQVLPGLEAVHRRGVVVARGVGFGLGAHGTQRLPLGLPQLRQLQPGARIARVQRGDLWAADWSGYDLVYLFQRPESMERAAAKAVRELRPGAWLVSLEFEVVGWAPTAVLDPEGGKRVWLYRSPLRK